MFNKEQCKQGREHEYNAIFRKHQRKLEATKKNIN